DWHPVGYGDCCTLHVFPPPRRLRRAPLPPAERYGTSRMQATSRRSLQVAILGAGGTIAPAIVRDLAPSEEVEGMLLLDLDGARAQQVAEEHGGGSTRAQAVDATNPEALTSALGQVDVLLNSAS